MYPLTPPSAPPLYDGRNDSRHVRSSSTALKPNRSAARPHRSGASGGDKGQCGVCRRMTPHRWARTWCQTPPDRRKRSGAFGWCSRRGTACPGRHPACRRPTPAPAPPSHITHACMARTQSRPPPISSHVIAHHHPPQHGVLASQHLLVAAPVRVSHQVGDGGERAQAAQPRTWCGYERANARLWLPPPHLRV